MKKIRDYKKQYEMEKSILNNKPIKCEKRNYDFFDAHSFYWEIEDILVPYYIEGILLTFVLNYEFFQKGKFSKRNIQKVLDFIF